MVKSAGNRVIYSFDFGIIHFILSAIHHSFGCHFKELNYFWLFNLNNIKWVGKKNSGFFEIVARLQSTSVTPNTNEENSIKINILKS